MKHLLLIIPISTILLLSACAKPAPDIAAETAAVKAVLAHVLEAEQNEDSSLYDAVMSQETNMVNFGAGPDSRYVGLAEFKASQEEKYSMLEDVEVEAADQVITIHESGTVAWFSEVLKYTAMIFGRDMDFELRFTGVMVKQPDGKWVIIQSHTSLPLQRNQ
jgi:ketosteroid isomerase-like protein